MHLSSARVEARLICMTTRALVILYRYLPVEECSWEKSNGAINEVISDYKSICCVSIQDRRLITHFQTTKRRRNEVVCIDSLGLLDLLRIRHLAGDIAAKARGEPSSKPRHLAQTNIF